jgi:hypothetical protein
VDLDLRRHPVCGLVPQGLGDERVSCHPSRFCFAFHA